MGTDLSSNFEERLLPALGAVLDLAFSSPLSVFYRAKYAGLEKPANFGEFRELPFLERGELLKTDWRQRLYVSENEIACFGVSSGTSGTGPLVIPRPAPVHTTYEPETLEELRSLGVTRVMLMLAPFSGAYAYNHGGVPGAPLTVQGSLKNIPGSEAIAGAVGVNGLVTTPTGLERFIESADSRGHRLDGLLWVSIGGEGLSRAKYDYLRARLPRAKFQVRFNASDAGVDRFYRCGRLTESPDLFHPYPDSHIFEILSPSGSPVGAGEEGELVHTDLVLPRPFPFIRYRTGDGAALVPGAACPCGNPYLLRMSGKLGFDELRYAGAKITVEMVEKVLRRLEDLVLSDFRLHLYEEVKEGRPRPGLRLLLIPRAPRLAGPERERLAERLAAFITAELRLTAERTLADLCAAGDFLPLKIELADAFHEEAPKPRRLISHVQERRP